MSQYDQILGGYLNTHQEGLLSERKRGMIGYRKKYSSPTKAPRKKNSKIVVKCYILIKFTHSNDNEKQIRQ